MATPSVVIWAEFTADGCVVYGRQYNELAVVSRRLLWEQLDKDTVSAVIKDVTEAVMNSKKETNMTMVRKIDLKHHIDDKGQIIKTGNGVPIPEEEPLILFRARDRLAVPMLRAYRELCIADGCNDFQLGQIDELITRFVTFASANPQVMKQPGITRGL